MDLDHIEKQVNRLIILRDRLTHKVVRIDDIDKTKPPRYEVRAGATFTSVEPDEATANQFVSRLNAVLAGFLEEEEDKFKEILSKEIA